MVKRLSVIDVERCVGCQSCMFACNRRLGKGGIKDSCIQVHSAGGIRKGFVVVVCRACEDAPCARVCPTNALELREGGGVHLHADKCIGCGNCVKNCPYGAISWNNETHKPIVCTYCGFCTTYCPYDVLAHEEVVR